MRILWCTGDFFCEYLSTVHQLYDHYLLGISSSLCYYPVCDIGRRRSVTTPQRSFPDASTAMGSLALVPSLVTSTMIVIGRYCYLAPLIVSHCLLTLGCSSLLASHCLVTIGQEVRTVLGVHSIEGATFLWGAAILFGHTRCQRSR